MPNFLKDEAREIETWFAKKAAKMLSGSLGPADVSAELKDLAAQHDLPSFPDMIDRAIERAWRNFSTQAELESELNAGHGPMLINSSVPERFCNTGQAGGDRKSDRR